MPRLWSRKRNESNGLGPEAAESVDIVHLDDEDHAWWVQAEIHRAWTPLDRNRTTPEPEERPQEQP